MCGLFGTTHWNGTEDTNRLAAMAQALRHRGPDAYHQTHLRHVSMGLCRLEINDPLSGSQPFESPDGSVTVMCNGEIFNHRELMDEFPGYQPRSHCDVEVLPLLYQKYGISMLEKVNGQFAMAIYDHREDVLYLARDRFGICPLYYERSSDGEHHFASEIGALLGTGTSATIDLTSLDQAFTLPTVISPRTMFAEIRAVRPGHYLKVTAEKASEHRHWGLVYPSSTKDLITDEDAAIELIRDRLVSAVRHRLQSDAAIGLYVSGGLDSAVIAALAAREDRDHKVSHSFSVSFTDAVLDESSYQRAVVDELPTQHVTVPVGPRDICEHLAQTVLHSAVPMRESYNVASILLAKAARDHGVKSVLSGEGSDELFAGYTGYRFDEFRGAGEATPGARAKRQRMWGDGDYGYDFDFDDLERQRLRLYSPDLRSSFEQFDCTTAPVVEHNEMRGRHKMHQRSYLDVYLRLSDHLLGDHGDRMVMAHSIEGRYPFLDESVVEAAKAIHPSLKLRDYTEKWILKQACQGIVCDTVLTREKFPFTAPDSARLLEADPDFVRDWLSEPTLRRHNLFDPQAVGSLIDSTIGRSNAPTRTDWLMLVLTSTMLAEQSAGGGSNQPCAVAA